MKYTLSLILIISLCVCVCVCLDRAQPIEPHWQGLSLCVLMVDVLLKPTSISLSTNNLVVAGKVITVESARIGETRMYRIFFPKSIASFLGIYAQ